MVLLDRAVYRATVSSLGWFAPIAVTLLVIGINAPTLNCAARERVTAGRPLQMSASQVISCFRQSAGTSHFYREH